MIVYAEASRWGDALAYGRSCAEEHGDLVMIVDLRGRIVAQLDSEGVWWFAEFAPGR